jgi:hypothetical protein
MGDLKSEKLFLDGAESERKTTGSHLTFACNFERLGLTARSRFAFDRVEA